VGVPSNAWVPVSAEAADKLLALGSSEISREASGGAARQLPLRPTRVGRRRPTTAPSARSSFDIVSTPLGALQNAQRPHRANAVKRSERGVRHRIKLPTPQPAPHVLVGFECRDSNQSRAPPQPYGGGGSYDRWSGKGAAALVMASRASRLAEVPGVSGDEQERSRDSTENQDAEDSLLKPRT